MATHSSSLAWRIPWTEEPGVARGGHDLVTKPPNILPIKGNLVTIVDYKACIVFLHYKRICFLLNYYILKYEYN